MPGLPYLDGEVTGLSASFALEPERVVVDMHGGQVLARGIARGKDAAGSLRGHFETSIVHGGPGPSGDFAWDGTIGPLAETVSLGLENGRLDGAVDVRDAEPDAIRAFWPESPVTSSVKTHLDVHGPFDAVALSFVAQQGDATLDVTGTIGSGKTKHVAVHLEAARIDLHEWIPVVDASLVGARGDVSASLDDAGRLSGEASIEAPTGHIGRIEIPRTKLVTHGFREPNGAFGGDATVDIDEPGAPTTISLHATPVGTSSSVEFAIASRGIRLGAVTQVSTEATGTLKILGKGNVDLEKLHLDASLETHGAAVRRGDLSVGQIDVRGHARGHLLDPEVALDVRARNAAWGTRTVSDLDVHVTGKALTPHVTIRERSEALADVDADGDVDLRQDPTVHDLTLTAAHGGETLGIELRRATFAHGDIGVNGVVLRGLGGRIDASGQKSPGEVRFRVAGEGVDLGRVARLVDMQRVVASGTLTVDTDLVLRTASAKGRAKIALSHVSIASLDELSGHMDGQLAGRRFDGDVAVDMGAAGHVEAIAKNLALAGQGALLRATWKSLSGDVNLDGTVDLARLLPRLPKDALPLSAASGKVSVTGRFERDSIADVTPLVALELATKGLGLSGPLTSADKKPAWDVRGVDVTASARVNGDTGFSEVAVALADEKGPLASLAASSGNVPYGALSKAPGDAIALLPDIPFEAKLTLPRRSIASWPSLGRRRGTRVTAAGGVTDCDLGEGKDPLFDGTLEAVVDVRGPLVLPRVTLTATLATMANAGLRFTSPLELRARAVYANSHADAELLAAQEGESVLMAEAHGDVRARDLLFGDLAKLAWKASAKAHITALPLVTIGPLDDRGVRGRLDGDVEVKDLHDAASAHADLRVTSLRVGDAEYTLAHVLASLDGKNARVSVRFDQADGFGAVEASVPATWGASLLPVPDPRQQLSLDLEAKRFRLAAILPFLRGSLDELDGLVDAKVKATVDPVTEKVSLAGDVEVSDGVFQLGSFGGELHAIQAKATVTPEGVLTLEKLTADGVSGRLQASASARLDGLRLLAASAIVVMPKSTPLPISAQGSPIGSIDGRVEISEQLSTDKQTVTVIANVPSLHLLVPDRSGQDIQPLVPMEGVTVIGQKVRAHICTADAEPTDATAKLAASMSGPTVRIETKLGEDVSVRRGTDVRVDLRGGPTLTLTDKLRATGEVTLHGGTLNLYGKQFDIEQGTVTFVGDDISNPQVSVVAGWVAGDGTQIKAVFRGPLKTGKVTLQSQPSLSDNEIVQLLLFGSTDGQAASTQGAPGVSSAEGVAGTVATAPLNRALAQFGLSAVSAKVDTSAVNAKPEIEVQIAKGLSVAVAQILGQPPVGSNPDTAFLTVDWRFLKKWSVAATVGNAESTIVDLLWRYRY
jgi:translocation and assembly module TamB